MILLCCEKKLQWNHNFVVLRGCQKTTMESWFRWIVWDDKNMQHNCDFIEPYTTQSVFHCVKGGGGAKLVSQWNHGSVVDNLQWNHDSIGMTF